MRQQTMNAAGKRKAIRDPRLIEGVLANLPLMDGVSRQVVRELSTQSTVLSVKRGEVPVSRGQSVRGVYAIAYGSVKKRLRHPSGAERVLALLGPGDTFAEVPALLAQPSRVEVVALADSMLLMINAACISVQTERDPRLARNVANVLARRLQALLGELERGMLPSLQRLAAYIDSLAEPGAEPGSWVARLPVSKTLIAARLDMKKETLSRLLHELAERGTISVSRRVITILDRAGLAAVHRDKM
jgi:CRP-like cAMP-binding protein